MSQFDASVCLEPEDRTPVSATSHPGQLNMQVSVTDWSCGWPQQVRCHDLSASRAKATTAAPEVPRCPLYRRARGKSESDADIVKPARITLSGHHAVAEGSNQLVPQFRARYQRRTAVSTRDQRSVRPTATWHQYRLRHQHQAYRIDSEQWGQWIATCRSPPPLPAVDQREDDPLLPKSE